MYDQTMRNKSANDFLCDVAHRPRYKKEEVVDSVTEVWLFGGKSRVLTMPILSLGISKCRFVDA